MIFQNMLLYLVVSSMKVGTIFPGKLAMVVYLAPVLF